MDEFTNEVDYAEEEILEEEYEAPELEEIEQTEHQRAEAADLARLYRQHPEIWIPYEEQIQMNLNTHGHTPDTLTNADTPDLKISLRNLKSLDSTHRTYPFLTSYERTKCISFRASQINNGAKPYILVPEGISDSYVIAKMELEAKRLPYILKRPLPDGSFEVWRLNDLVVF
jgi:DNA-directed RNA polymerase I, II, and III subunit RPABC2